MTARSKAGSLINYILVRLLLTIPMLLILLTLVFILLRVAPGDPAAAMLGAHASVEVLEQMREQMGLNRPLYVQYFSFLGDVLTGDLGESFRFGIPVWDLIKHRLTATIELVLFGFTTAVLIGLAVGIFAANRRGTVWDVTGDFYGILTYAFPIFWLGIMCQLLFAVKLGWVPTSGRFSGFLDPPAMRTGLYVIDSLLEGRLDKLAVALRHLAMPAGVLGLYISGIFRPGPRGEGTLGQPAARAQERPRPGGHRPGAAVRPPARRGGPHRDHVQLAGGGELPGGAASRT